MRFLSALLVVLGLTAQSSFAGGEKNIVTSVLRSATVYRPGAELVHTATATLPMGSSELIISDVSNGLDIGSLHVSSTGNVTILSTTFSTEYLKPESASPFEKKLKDSVTALKKEIAKVDVLIASDSELLDMLAANKKIAGNNGLTLVELAKTVDYYKQKSIEIRTELNGYYEKSDKWQELIEKLQAQIDEEEKKNTRTGGRLILQVMSPQAGEANFTISYITKAATWAPFYDLKVDNVNDPLRIIYKARLWQTTGLDWKKVKLSLSTSQPGLSGNAPILKTWFLRFVESQVYYRNSLNLNLTANILAFKDAEQDLKRKVVGYSTVKADSIAYKDDLGDYVSVNDNQLDVTFDIDIPYDVPTNGKEQGVVLREYKVPCYYQYYSAPRADKEAYLLGGITGWEKLNLLPGEANLIVEGANIGKSFIDPSAVQDTLNLTLGHDKRIVVKKEKVTDYSSVKFLGSNKKQIFTYDITVRNNKKEKVEMLLKDQHPISSTKDIEEELLESSGAVVNNDTGILSWKLELAPGETKKFRVSYSVKYPKDKEININ